MSGRRSEDAYVLDTGLRLLKVLGALEGTNFEPVSTQRVQERTGFTYDFCRRALFTLKKAGYATQSGGGWQVGPKLLRFSGRFHELCAAAIMGERSQICDLSDPENPRFP